MEKKTKIVLAVVVVAILVVSSVLFFVVSQEKKNDNIIEVPQNNGSTIYKQIGDEINITLSNSIACEWKVDDFGRSVLSLKDDFNWSNSAGEPGIPPPTGDAGNRTWIFEVIGQGQTTLKFTSYYMANKPYTIYGTYVLHVVVE